MNVILTYSQFQKNHIYFYEPIENTIMENSQFIKLIYSTEDLILNGIYILMNINISSKESYFKKMKYNFDLNNNRDLLNHIFRIEKEILNNYNHSKKIQKLNIYESLNTGSLKIYPSSDSNKPPNNFILKISGVWENEKEYGLTFKILPVG